MSYRLTAEGRLVLEHKIVSITEFARETSLDRDTINNLYKINYLFRSDTYKVLKGLKKESGEPLFKNCHFIKDTKQARYCFATTSEKDKTNTIITAQVEKQLITLYKAMCVNPKYDYLRDIFDTPQAFSHLLEGWRAKSSEWLTEQLLSWKEIGHGKKRKAIAMLYGEFFDPTHGEKMLNVGEKQKKLTESLPSIVALRYCVGQGNAIYPDSPVELDESLYELINIDETSTIYSLIEPYAEFCHRNTVEYLVFEVKASKLERVRNGCPSFDQPERTRMRLFAEIEKKISDSFDNIFNMLHHGYILEDYILPACQDALPTWMLNSQMQGNKFCFYARNRQEVKQIRTHNSVPFETVFKLLCSYYLSHLNSFELDDPLRKQYQETVEKFLKEFSQRYSRSGTVRCNSLQEYTFSNAGETGTVCD